jgi:hypothetical protein
MRLLFDFAISGVCDLPIDRSGDYLRGTFLGFFLVVLIVT